MAEPASNTEGGAGSDQYHYQFVAFIALGVRNTALPNSSAAEHQVLA